MKKYLIYALIGTTAVGGVIGVFVVKNKTKPKTTQTQTITQPSPTFEQSPQIDYQDIFSEEPNVCQLFPKEKIEELLGKTFVTSTSGVNKTSKYTEYYCEYHQEEPKFYYEGDLPIPSKRLPISIIKGEVKDLREVYKLSGYQAKQDSEIPFPHQLIYSDKGKFQRLEISLSDNLNLHINTFQSNLTDEEALNFVKKFARYLKDFIENKTNFSSQQPTSSPASNQAVPLPQDEDIIRNFVSQIEEKRPEEAAKMMKINDQSPPQANSELQAWAVQFAAINSFKLLKMEKANENQWTETKHIYKVVLDVLMDPASANAPIPYYGWENGQNTRWIVLEKVGDTWKIAEIATGP